jgi:dUTP pyrophosphatase
MEHIHPDLEARTQMLVRHNAKTRDKIDVQLMHDAAKLPTKVNKFDAGWDLYSVDNCAIDPSNRQLVNIGIALAIPKGYVGLIWPRSGLAVKNGVDVFAGVIDSGYRGEVKVCLYNSSTETIHISPGDRIAQILFQTIGQFDLVKTIQLTNTPRDVGGFGSSGV